MTAPPLPRRNAGSALVASVVLVMAMGVMVLAFLGVSMDARHETALDVEEQLAEVAAESATALAANRIWGAFQAERDGQPTDAWDFRLYLDELGITDQAGAPLPSPTEILPLVDLPDAAAGEQGLDGVVVESIRLQREDGASRTRLVFTTAVAVPRGDAGSGLSPLRRAVQQSYLVEAAPWRGLDYVLLANNINCVMCHATFDDAHRVYNEDAGLFGTFERVKVGSIESIQLRNSVDSSIAGTLYLGGKAFDKSGAPITDWASRDLKSRRFSPDGHLLEDSWGETTVADLSPADLLEPAPFENLYVGYAPTDGEQIDGYFPDAFPSVFPDDGGVDPVTLLPDPDAAGNRTIDPAEFHAATANSTGSLSGGTIHVVDPGTTVDTPTELKALTSTETVGNLDAITTGSVFLVGTEDNPILLNGEIAIDGDLVISGVVKGEGSLKVAGNVYIPTDLSYADGIDAGTGARSFGVGAGGSVNALAIAAGGNILVGNIFHGRRGNGSVTGDPDGSFSFIMDELAIFNRAEWTKTQPLLPGAGDDPTDPSSYSEPNPGYAGPDYLPRYYTFADGSTLPVFNKGVSWDPATGTWKGKEHPGGWKDKYLTYADPGDPTDPLLFHDDGTPRARVMHLTGTDGWISDALLETMMRDFLDLREDAGLSGEPLTIEATLYSNNSIFGIVPTAARAPGADGELLVNGAIVAADIGLLAAKGVQMHFDRRGRSLLDLTSDTQLGIRRELWAPSP